MSESLFDGIPRTETRSAGGAEPHPIGWVGGSVGRAETSNVIAVVWRGMIG